MKEGLSLQFTDEVSIVLCGPAGSGVQTVERMLVHICKHAGYNVFATKEYMSRVRGGLNSTTIRAASEPVRASVHQMDIVIALAKGALEHVRDRLTDKTLILCEPDFIDDETREISSNYLEIPFSDIAKEIGNKIYSNIVAVGVVSDLLGIEQKVVTDMIRERFEDKDENVINENIQAVGKGYEISDELLAKNGIKINISTDENVDSQMLLSGGEAIGLGAIAGGCNFIGAYPMSPSTGLLQFLAKHSIDFNILVEQAEDEIAGMNMAIGAWYAGARAIANTSGGGFALMTEGLSLAGMIESPLVVHLAQRPGPATGLPTRTAQEDLNLALYAGHGEFPRAIFTPGDLQEGFDLTVKAFDLADRFQVPVFILTDQYFMDSYYNTEHFDLSGIQHEKHFIKTDKDYRRYALTENGLSPRGIPGHGEGLIVVDSDEHDEDGHITEDLDLRTRMVDKRLAKMELLEDAVIEPTLWPNENYKYLVLCWGSTLTVAKEAIKMLGRDDISLLHFSQVFPLPLDLSDIFEQAEKVICMEGNATGQFANLLSLHGYEIDDCLLKYNGLQFTVEETADSIRSII